MQRTAKDNATPGPVTDRLSALVERSRARIVAWREKIAAEERFLRDLQERQKELTEDDAPEADKTQAKTEDRSHANGEAGQKIADQIAALLDHSGAMRQRDIAARLEVSVVSVAAALRREEDRFERVERGVYRLKGTK